MPIESVNVNEVALNLIHINTRNILSSIHKFALRKNISNLDERRYIEKNGELVFSKILKLNAVEKNHKTITAVPIIDIRQKPGLYLLTARKVGEDSHHNYGKLESQWLVVSDIGLFTIQTEDYLHIFSHKLSAANVRDNLQINLLSNANEILSTTSTDQDGYVKIPASLLKGNGGKAAKLILAHGDNGDFGLIDITRPEHDFSDRGVSGRKPPSSVDAFLYSNRNLFKPDETVSVHGLIRDNNARAIGELQVKLKLVGPDQREVATTSLKSDVSGYINWQTNIPITARTGSYQIEIYAGAKKPVGKYSFLLENFVPPKTKVSLTSDISSVKPGQKFKLKATANYLHGAPLAFASANLDMVIEKDPKPFAGYKDYIFGDLQEYFRTKRVDLKNKAFKTDASGNLEIIIDEIKKVYSTSYPLRLKANLSVMEPGGRPLNTGVDFSYKNQDSYIGIKPAFSAGSVDTADDAIFQVVVLEDSDPAAARINYTLFKEEENGYWTETNGKWQYHESFIDGAKIKSGKLDVLPDEANNLKFNNLDWGTYRLDLMYGNARTSYRFVSGNTETSGRTIADKLKVFSDKAEYQVGDRIKLGITPDFTGPILLNVLNHKLLKKQILLGQAGKTAEIEIKAEADWGSGAYVMATSFYHNPNYNQPNRSIGLVHIKIASDNKKIPLEISHPAQIESAAELEISVKAKVNQESFVTVALVDEGILNLTNYERPEPFSWFNGQLGLVAKVRDIYGDLIRPQGIAGEYRVGGGDEMEVALGGGAPRNLRKIVALFSEKIKFDSAGKAKAVFSVPDYQGALKVLVVAWNKDALGSASGTVYVRDKISPEIYLPRFLAVGDETESILGLDFANTVASGEYRLSIDTNDKLSVDVGEFVKKQMLEDIASGKVAIDPNDPDAI